MGKILIEGVGIVDIAGDRPTEEELRQLEQELQDVPPRLGTAARPGEARSATQEEFLRARVRESVDELPGVAELVAEITPSVGGEVIGGALGSVGGPLGIAAGASLGGFLGELLAQETGITERSAGNLALSTIGGPLGIAAGGGLKLGRRAGGGFVGMLPPVKAAIGRMTEMEAIGEFESLGAKILRNQKGLMGRSSGDLYNSAAVRGGTVPGRELKNTSRTLAELDKELQIIADFPEGAQAIAMIDRVVATLGREAPISFDTFVKTRQLLGSAVRRAERASGLRLGTAKKLYKAMSDDIDTIAAGTTKARRPAAVVQAAAKRAKLEFAIRDIEAVVARFSTDVPGKQGVSELNVRGVQKWFKDATNPKSVKFDKNLSSALEDEIPAIQRNLSDLAKLSESLNPAGPGSIVVRGIGARTGRTIIGGLIGFGTAGPVGGGLGALAGASIPEMMTGLLTSPRAARMLKRAVRLGRGEISAERWAFLGQVLARSGGVEINEEQEGGIKTISDLQRLAVKGAVGEGTDAIRSAREGLAGFFGK